MKAQLLPPTFLKCVSPADRIALKLGLTPEEALQRAVVKSERQLQTLLINFLRLRGIEPLWHRTDKRSAATIGWPDITFAVRGYDRDEMKFADYPCGWEVKYDKGKLSDEQEKLHVQLSAPPNAWRIRVITSVDEALAELKELGL